MHRRIKAIAREMHLSMHTVMLVAVQRFIDIENAKDREVNREITRGEEVTREIRQEIRRVATEMERR
jgi:predicted transcriptional regulator